MLFPNIPKIEYDEYIYSYVLRTALANGFDIRSIYEVVFKETWTKYGKNNYDFDMNIIELSELFGMETALPFYLHTSLFNGVAPFMNRSDIAKRIELLNNHHMSMQKKFIKNSCLVKSLKICPECMAEEIEKKQFFYYHRSHQMPNVTVCYKHHCALKEVECEYGKEFEYPLQLKDLMDIDIRDVNGYANFCHRMLFCNFDVGETSIKQYLMFKLDKDYSKEFNYEDLLVECYYIFGENVEASYFNKLLLLKPYSKLLDEEILSSGNYTLLNSNVEYKNKKFYDDRIVELVHKDCNTRFITTPYRMLQGYGCPFCDSKKDQTELYIEALNRTINGQYDLIEETIDPTTDFYTIDGIDKREGQLEILSLNGEFLEVKHSSCGEVFKVNKRNILKQPWCKICYPKNETTASFERKLKSYVGDEYSLIGEYKSAKNKITLLHNVCGRKLVCYPRNVYEGMRCHYCTHKSVPELFAEALKEIYNEDDFVFLEDVDLPDFPKNRNKDNFAKAIKKGALYKIQPGIYSFIPKEVSNEAIYEAKYLLRNGNRIGYFKGLSFAFEIGLITEKPEITSICYNKEASSHGRTMTYFGIKTKIHATPIEVNNDNWMVVATLDFLTSSKYLGFEYDELDPLWQWLRANDISCSDFDDYYKYFGSWVEKKLKQYFKEA